MAQHPHLTVLEDSSPLRFTSPNSARSDPFRLPDRNRRLHAESLIAKIEEIEPAAREKANEQRAFGLDDGFGVYLTFASQQNFELKFESLDLTSRGIELCAVKTTADNRQQATVFVPDGKLDIFLNKIKAYRDEQTTPRREGASTRPKNQDLVESISDIQLVALEALWTENGLPFPPLDQRITWEVWLRRSDAIDHMARLQLHAAAFDLVVGEQSVTFIDRKVILITGTARALSRSIDILGMIAELRQPQTPVAFFSDMGGIDQREWVAELTNRLSSSSSNPPYVCLFDTGLNHSHPLLSNITAVTDVHTYKPAWGVDDREGHGTPMAGLAAIGDLAEALAGAGPITIGHRLESVKIVNENDPHERELYGAVVQESAFRVEVIAERKRVFCMAVTASDGRDRGRPSSWSAAIDSLASGAEDDQQRLFVLSAGNTDPGARCNYPDSNMTDGIHDPAQAWNALTVGGYTDKALIDATQYPGWLPLAARGDLSPSSCTSVTWGKWPIKPDIVMEAGNMGRNPEFPDPDYIDDNLQLLTTRHDFSTNKPLTTFGDTSAAAALAARLAALVWSKYPNYRPETVRALLVHAARWTPAMLARATDRQGSVNYNHLMRCFGHGVPDKRRLLSSLDNSLTLIVEGDLQPFFKDEEDPQKRVKTRDMRVHELPWPISELGALQNTDVTMRVTLSYFIEPSPGSRGWTARYGYQSHGLRFAVRNPLESVPAFQARINKAVRDDDYTSAGLSDRGWQFGYGQRSLTSLGSIHSDTWRGKAVDLASRGCVAVYPTMGWWNKRPQLKGWEKTARYSLIITIETPGIETDIYTPVANQIGIPIIIE